MAHHLTELRRKKGFEIASTCKIVRKDGGWLVPSQTGKKSYRVILNPSQFVPQCTCPDFANTQEKCKHVFAVEIVIEREKRGERVDECANFMTDKAAVPRRTYKQVWSVYHIAQTVEKARFLGILADLCRDIKQPPWSGKAGRPKLSLADMVFSAAFKVYSTFSTRRFMTDLAEAKAKGYIDHTPHFNSVLNYLKEPALRPILTELVEKSSLPLRAVEVDFAVDSSGFSTSRFLNWFDHKYGRPRREYDWVKMSLIAGVKTNIVAAVEIDERYGADSPKFAPLVNKAAKYFKIREVSADAQYTSYANAELVDKLGGKPFFDFKSNTTGAQGGVFNRMFHYYNFNQEEYLNHYHKRSNAESTFSMIKAKFGDHLRSKSEEAMVNEALCKVLCHNICCLIQSAYELGISPTFWTDEAAIEFADGVDGVGAYEWV